MDTNTAQQAPATLPDRPEFVYKPKRSTLFAVVVMLIVIIGGAASYGVYRQQRHKAAGLKSENTMLTAQLQAVQQQTAALKAQNSGDVSFSVEPVSQTLSLDNGAASLTIPSGWTKATDKRLNTICRGIVIDSDALCYDTAAIVPSNFNNSQDSYAYSGAQVSMYQRKANETAKDWYEGVLGGYTASSTNFPAVKTLPIKSLGGNDTYAVEVTANDPKISSDRYAVVYYTIVSGDYAVVVESRLVYQDEAANGAVRDYSSYAVDLQKFANTIKFQK